MTNFTPANALVGAGFLLFGVSLSAQNLIPNPSFEDFINCPTGISEYDSNTKFWTNPNVRTPDLFNECRGDSCGTLGFGSVCVPVNIKGAQMPKTGKGYVGIFSGGGYFSREYLQVPFLETLKAGEKYKLSFYISLADNYSKAIEKMGAYFSVDQISALDHLDYEPQIFSAEGKFLSNKKGWTLIEGIVTAEGGERYLTIGNFQNEVELNYISGLGGLEPYAYYYVDEVRLKQLDSALNILKDTSICRGDSILLFIDSSSDYRWAQSDFPQNILGENESIMVTPLENTTYLAFNEKDTVQVTIAVIDYPKVDLGEDTLLCRGASFVLDVELAEATYLWQDTSKKSTYWPSEPGVYSVAVNLYGCIGKDAIEIFYDELPIPDLGSDQGLCAGESLLFDVSSSLVNAYLWENGFNKPTRQIEEEGVYWVELTGKRCTTRDTLVLVDDSFIFDLGGDTTLCKGDALLLNPKITNAQYYWSVPIMVSTISTLSVSDPGLYWLEVVKNTCRFRDSILIDSKPLPFSTLPEEAILCEGETLFIDLYQPDVRYLWNDGSLSPSISIDESGLYTVVLEWNDCRVTEELEVIKEDFSFVDLGEDLKICPGDRILLDAYAEGASYKWNTGSRESSVRVYDLGEYIVELKGEKCSFRDSILIEKQDRSCKCVLYTPNVFSPNADGVHDTFGPEMNCELSDYRFVIFSRWGEKVFESREVGETWNGRFNRRLVGPGIYVYQISYFSHRLNQTEVESGTVMVFR